MNFFDPACYENMVHYEDQFGLCDDKNGAKAYVDTSNQNKWIATVINETDIGITFSAVDKCVIRDDEYPGRGRCDCMLTSSTNEHLYFVELNTSMKGWVEESLQQLESTIAFFREAHDLAKYRHKKTYASNKRFQAFHSNYTEQMQRFYRKNAVRLEIGNIIKIK